MTTKKILLIDWELISPETDFSLFPPAFENWFHSLCKRDSEFERFGDEVLVNMRVACLSQGWSELPSIERAFGYGNIARFKSSSGDEALLQAGILYWYCSKTLNSLWVGDSCVEKVFEKTYNLNPLLVESYYNKYYQFFQKKYLFRADDFVRRLIERKPTGWTFGIVSKIRTKAEINLLFSKKLSSMKYSSIDYEEVFSSGFYADASISPIRFKHPQSLDENKALDKRMLRQAGYVFEKVKRHKFDEETRVYIMSNCFDFADNSNVHKIEVGESELLDKFDFNNPKQDLSKSTYRYSNKPKKIPYLHTIIAEKLGWKKGTPNILKGDTPVALWFFCGIVVLIIGGILDFLGVVEHYENVLLFWVALPTSLGFILFCVFFLLLVAQEIIVQAINHYYKHRNLGFSVIGSLMQIVVSLKKSVLSPAGIFLGVIMLLYWLLTLQQQH